MRTQRTLLHTAALAVFALVFAYAQISGMSWVREIELSVQDALMRFGRPAVADPGLVFLARDTASANLDATDMEKLFDLRLADAEARRALELMTHEWPWSREVYALVLERLMSAGARAVAFDLTFPKPSPNDDPFRESLERHRDRVVVAGNITEEFGGSAFAFGVPTPTLIPHTESRDSRIGFDNFWADEDGLVRSADYRWAFRSGIWEGNEEFSLAARTLQKAGLGDAVPERREGHVLRFAGPPGTFRAHSIHEIFVPKYWHRNYGDGAFFKDKIVVIGASGNWQHDEHATAFGIMSGAEIQINAINAARHRDFLKVVSWPVSLGLCFFAAALALGCCLLRPSPFLHVVLILLSALVWVGAQVMLFDRPGLYIPIVGPLAIMGVGGLFSITYDLVALGRERLRLRRNILEQQRAEEILRSANDELERRVAERTAELSKSNASLTTLLEEKDVLLKEVHHRVKNNLQVISSLLNLQAGHIEDPVALQVFLESRNRVRSMALIHEKLYQSHDLARIDFEDYIRTLSSGLLSGFAGKGSKVRITVDVEKIMLPVDSAVPCGLIVNELVTNCFKYAFTPAGGGEIRIGMKRLDAANFQLSVSDNGVGFPKNIDFRNTESLGMQLVTTLADQLDGTISLSNGAGTTFEIAFPEAQKPQV